MRTVVMSSLMLGMILAAPARSYDTITIEATIRDFTASHPDFQGKIARDRGIIATAIGEDRKPQYIRGAKTRTTGGAASFSQWYNDTPGVNVSMPYDLVLTDMGGGLYQCRNKSFFPIDDQLLGNEGRSHNYNFTMELHAQFTYQPGQMIKCSGDDDLFVFIDDHRVIDLGGVHPVNSAALNLDTLGLTPGREYAFDLFYAERHAIWSNFCLWTSIPLEPLDSLVPIDPFEPPVAPAPGSILLGALGTALIGWLRQHKAL